MFLSVFFYLIAFLLGVYLIRAHSVLYNKIFLILILSCLGHAAGTYFYSLAPSDSTTQYFPFASPYFNNLGTEFAATVVWYIRYFLTGDSVLETFYFFSAFSFLGSVSWYVLYLKFLKNLNLSGQSLAWPALILMCWPSWLIFTAGMVKDSLCFLLIPTIFINYLNLIDQKNRTWNGISLFIALLLMTMIRPYLLMLMLFAALIYKIRNLKSFNIWYLISAILLIIIAFWVADWVLKTQGRFETVSLNSIAQKSALQQNLQEQGTDFYMPSINPLIRLFLLPYSLVMNLCFPLIYLARNLMGYMASLENILLVSLIGITWKFKNQVKKMFSAKPHLSFLFYFFVIGMAFLGIGNTNLGLSMRQKSMYVPAFLIIYCLIYALRKNAIKNAVKKPIKY